MSMDTSTSLAAFKQKDIIVACIYKGKAKEEHRKLVEPYLVVLYEGLMKTYNFNPDYIV